MALLHQGVASISVNVQKLCTLFYKFCVIIISIVAPTLTNLTFKAVTYNSFDLVTDTASLEVNGKADGKIDVFLVNVKMGSEEVETNVTYRENMIFSVYVPSFCSSAAYIFTIRAIYANKFSNDTSTLTASRVG